MIILNINNIIINSCITLQLSICYCAFRISHLFSITITSIDFTFTNYSGLAFKVSKLFSL